MAAVAGFLAVLGVSAAYYVASRLLGGGVRRSGVYACGEEWGAVEEAEPGFPWAVLLVACLEPAPVVGFLVGGVDGALLLGVAAVGAAVVAGRVAGG